MIEVLTLSALSYQRAHKLLGQLGLFIYVFEPEWLVGIAEDRMAKLVAEIAVVFNFLHQCEEASIVGQWSAKPETLELDPSLIVAVKLAAKV